MDRTTAYLSGLQTGYRINEITFGPYAGTEVVSLVPYNPYRVTLFLSSGEASTASFWIKLPSGIWANWYAQSEFRIYLQWTKDQHLVYQEVGVNNVGTGVIRGFEVIKS